MYPLFGVPFYFYYWYTCTDNLPDRYVSCQNEQHFRVSLVLFSLSQACQASAKFSRRATPPRKLEEEELQATCISFLSAWSSSLHAVRPSSHLVSKLLGLNMESSSSGKPHLQLVCIAHLLPTLLSQSQPCRRLYPHCRYQTGYQYCSVSLTWDRAEQGPSVLQPEPPCQNQRLFPCSSPSAWKHSAIPVAFWEATAKCDICSCSCSVLFTIMDLNHHCYHLQ